MQALLHRLFPAFLILLVFLPAATPASERPDLVVFLSDDHTLRDSSVYGSPDIRTPNMDRLAAAGMTFDRAYVASPSCAPSRAAMLTGMWPARNGSEANHSRPQADIKKLPAYLKELGYEVVAFGKVGHYVQTPEYGFDLARHFTYHEDIAIPEAVKWLRERKSDQPLCLFVGTNWPHVPWPEAKDGIDPAALTVPPNHVDSPSTREWRARYVAAIGEMDRELGLVHDTARQVLGEDTFFLHTSDHGAQWPFGKWTLYDDGTRTPMIVSWPGRIAPGQRTDAMVSWIDILPTLIEAAGGQAPAQIDGRSFLPVLLGKADTHRRFVFTTHSGDGRFNVYPMRAVIDTDGNKYIRNLHPEFRFLSHVTKNTGDSGYWHSWLDQATSDEAARERVRAYQSRPAGELYLTTSDPWEQDNLATDPQHQKTLERLSAELDAWMAETKDPQTVFGEPVLISETTRPNVVMVFVDDMGWSDLSCFGNTEIQTEALDQLAAEGMRFERFYVNAPICSPSRTALTTGQYPQRWRISSYLDNRQKNQERGVAQWLDPAAPVLARELRRSGYATGHFGKWHLGGQRDVANAPPITDYGFDRSLTNFEGLGAKLLPLTITPQNREPKQIWSDAVNLGSPVTWTMRSEITGAFVGEAIRFIDHATATNQPFYVNVWPDDPHGPWFPSLENWSEDKRRRYLGVVDEMDAQLAPLFERIREDAALRENTLILFCSDNGPEIGIGSAGALRGGKTWLFEGGIRSPLIVWGPGLMAPGTAGTTDAKSVLCALDLNRSLYALTNTPLPANGTLDGENLIATILGKERRSRQAPIFFRRPPDRPGFGHGLPDQDNPDLAVVEGNWKYLVNLDGSDPQLYDLAADPAEAHNLAGERAEVAARLKTAVLAWDASLPRDGVDPAFQPDPLPAKAKGGKGKAKGKSKGKKGQP
ncbi:MAG: sulfatase-like hydrolase/transferase [Verrucomicrobiales bacterium]|nr:sulfatase-like hydrolase/transferase [Verrucomicrobiales bacterium]